MCAHPCAGSAIMIGIGLVILIFSSTALRCSYVAIISLYTSIVKSEHAL